MKIKKLTLLFFTFIFTGLLYSQERLPFGYKDIQLGMSLEETKEALLQDSSFGYHGDRDVSLVPGKNQTLIETDAINGHGSGFLERCWFQFSNDSLYIITINMNTERMDYYSVFTTLSKKYGEPTSINPNCATWKNDNVTMSLEKPLTLKYIDNSVFESLQQYSNIQKTGTEITKQMFLDEL